MIPLLALILALIIAIVILTIFWLTLKVYAYQTARELYPDRHITHKTPNWQTAYYSDWNIIGEHGCILTSTENNDHCDGEKDSHSETVNLWHSSECTNKSVLSDCTKI